jgi:hypothetical protein
MSVHGEPGEIAQLIGLARVFTPADAAEVLRSAGLEDITECALRTRAYRKQIPFHRNGHRIIFTVEDLREIAEGQAIRPQAAEREAEPAERSSTAVPGRTVHRVARRTPSQLPADAWRARRPPHG